MFNSTALLKFASCSMVFPSPFCHSDVATHEAYTGRGSSVSRESVNNLLRAYPRSTPTSGTFFREDFVMKIILRLFFCLFKKSSCQLMAKGCTLNTGKLPPGGLPGNSDLKH